MTTTTTEIKRAYLMWVGSEHYPTIDDYVKEAEALGVSKRLPNENVAGKLMEPGTVIFIAHDEGKAEPCDKCVGSMENPELRKAENRVHIQERAIDKLKSELKVLKKDKALSDADKATAVTKAEAGIERAERKLAKLTAEWKATDKTVKDSTGGHIDIDGSTWDYRRYNYWLHQPAKFDPASHKVENNKMCEHCGGTGRLPLGKVFGMILPSAIEYIMRPEDGPKVKAEMEARGFRVVASGAIQKEAKRGCGKRKPGGFYAVSDKEAKRTAQEVLKKLVESGAIKDGEVEVSGDFIRFVTPVDIPGTKRFRGIKSWALNVEVEREAEMIMEAVAS